MWDRIVLVPEHSLYFYFYLKVKTGRWRNVPRVERKCHLRSSDIGDEYHYLMICKNLRSIRKNYKQRIIVNDRILINLQKKKMMNSTNANVLRKLCVFVD